MAEAVSKAEFSRRINRDRAYVTRLAQQGRLVLDGDKVVVADSLRMIESTRGDRDDVAARHEAARAKKKHENVPAEPQPDTLERARRVRYFAETRIKAAQAEKEEMERDLLAGRLVERADAERAMRDLGAAVRAALDCYADQVAPLVAPIGDLNEVHAVLAEQCRNVLVQVGEALRKQQDALQPR